jgi:two-component system, OmpR family, sensor histidine kinase MprB
VSFRRRITLVSAAAVAIAVVLASLLVYMLTSEQLHNQVDKQLASRAAVLRLAPAGRVGTESSRQALLELLGRQSAARAPQDGAAAPGAETPGAQLRNLPPRPDQVRGYQQLVDATGAVVFRSANVTLPVDQRTTALAAADDGVPASFYRDATVSGVHLRIFAEHIAPRRALQVAQPLTEVDDLLGRLRLILGLLDGGGIALAALLGRLVAGTAVQPLKRLMQTTEHVALTRDLSERIASTGEDEIGRLASSFNAMLDALERSMTALDASVDAQRQLVADASHELRTPVTSLRTNIELLQQQGTTIDEATRQTLLGDVLEQIEELTRLINDLIDLARGEQPVTDVEDVRLDLLVAEVLERKRADTVVQLDLQPTLVVGVPARFERAIGNLLDNAIKYSPPGASVEVSLRGGELTVRDHGPGIAEHDLPFVFDRFYRGAEARGRPGSGLGLAIVRQLADQQGGAIVAERAPGGGTLMRLRLPGCEPVPAAGEPDELQPA